MREEEEAAAAAPAVASRQHHSKHYLGSRRRHRGYPNLVALSFGPRRAPSKALDALPSLFSVCAIATSSAQRHRSKRIRRSPWILAMVRWPFRHLRDLRPCKSHQIHLDPSRKTTQPTARVARSPRVQRIMGERQCTSHGRYKGTLRDLDGHTCPRCGSATVGPSF